MNIWPLISSFLLIAAAELGDKTQLLTLGFAARFPLWEVILAISSATAVLMVLAVLLGGVINLWVPGFYLQLAAGIIFILFGLISLRDGQEHKEENKTPALKNPFALIFTAFFLAELGDKTQLSTFALCAQYGSPLLVWLGATAGMICVNIIAALAGRWLQKHVNEKTLKYVGAVIFLAFGLWTLGSLPR